jgi:hypothetical protein
LSLMSVHSEGDIWSKNSYVDPVNPLSLTTEPTTLLPTPAIDTLPGPTLLPTPIDTDSAHQTSEHASCMLLLAIAGALALAFQWRLYRLDFMDSKVHYITLH